MPLLLKPPLALIVATVAPLLVSVPLLLKRLPAPEFWASGLVLLPARFHVPALLITPLPLKLICPVPLMVTTPVPALFQVLARNPVPLMLVAPPVVVSNPLPVSVPLMRLNTPPIATLPLPPSVPLNDRSTAARFAGPLAVNVPPPMVSLPASVEVVAGSFRVIEPPDRISGLLAFEFSPLMLCAPLAWVTVAPATRFRKATSVAPGSASPAQLKRSSQLTPSPSPSLLPSQQMPVQTPLAVRRNTLPANNAPLAPPGRVCVVKLPLAVPLAVITSKVWVVGVKPLIKVPISVPPKVTLPAPSPVTTTWSYCVPAIVPPISTSIVPVLTRLPMMLSVPAARAPPGLKVPWLVRVAVVRLTVPLPAMTPALFSAWPVVPSVAPAAMLMLPLLTVKVPGTVRLPALMLTTPAAALLKATPLTVVVPAPLLM